jgi:murein L,D-transpeptidase YafK
VTALTDDRSPPPRKRRRGRLAALFIILMFAFTALLLAPYWTPLLTKDGDERLIAFERQQRLWRAQMGFALPDEPDLGNLSGRLAANGLVEGAPIFIRIFKREFELELWMKRDGQFHRFAVYPICRWSGGLGPKLTQGDRQAPEGFYTVDQTALNPQSRWHRSFNLGYPNAFDRALGRTGSLIMVHGGCASVGCFAMTNRQIDEIWKLVTAALTGGQKRFQVQVYPFRMTDETMARYAGHPNEAFWRNLKQGHDQFEAALQPPRIRSCQGRYEFDAAGPNPDGDGPVDGRCPEATPKS